MHMKRRALEFIPATLVWGTLVIAIALSFIRPIWAIYFIIVFDLLWLFRVLYFVTYLFIAWIRFRRATRIDWLGKVRTLQKWERIRQVVFFPTYKEPYEVIRGTFRSLLASTYPAEKCIVVLGGEARDKENFLQHAERIKQEFGEALGELIITVHPKDLPDEIPGKGANLHYMGRELQKRVDELGLQYEDLIVSAFDVDTHVHLQYFAHLAYLYLTHPTPTRTSYQPVALYSNTIWHAPAPVRIAAFGTTFWLMAELARPERLMTFSSHSMSFQMLVDVGFWEKDIVSEDSRIFLQGFFHYHGDYTVTPMYLPVSMDTVAGETYGEYLKNLYKQQRRWAWGVEHFPYMMVRFASDPLIPLRKKWKYIWNHIEGMYTWATAPILIFILGWLPLYVASHGGSISGSVLVQNAPFTLEWLMRLAMLGVLVSGIVSLTLLPHPPAEKRHWHWLGMIAQWILLPITFVVFGAFPAIDAQTRLMLGKYLGFNVTAKRR
jgi:hypothetical protein